MSDGTVLGVGYVGYIMGTHTIYDLNQDPENRLGRSPAMTDTGELPSP